MSGWLAPLAALAAGLLIGAGLWWRARRTAAAAPPAPDPGADLEARRDALLAQLRELPAGEDGEGRRALELAAARVLRDLDLHAAAPPPSAAPPAPGRAGLRGFLYGAGTAGAVALLVFFVSRSAGERQEGGSLTGNTGQREAGADPELAPLAEAVARDPGNVDARLELVHAALARQDMMLVFEQTQAILEQQPGHPRALSYQALVRLAMGQADVAERMLKQAIAADPGLLDAYLHLALVHARTGHVAEGEAAIAEAARRAPKQADRLRALWAEMQEAGPEAGDAETAEAHAEPAPPAEGAADAVTGTVDLAPARRASVPAGATLFIVVRAEGEQAGAPVAAKRLAAGSWPVAFRVGAADSMMGGTLPARLRIEARVDGDGDPLTRDPTDPAGSLDGVALGSERLRLVLK